MSDFIVPRLLTWTPQPPYQMEKPWATPSPADKRCPPNHRRFTPRCSHPRSLGLTSSMRLPCKAVASCPRATSCLQGSPHLPFLFPLTCPPRQCLLVNCLPNPEQPAPNPLRTHTRQQDWAASSRDRGPTCKSDRPGPRQREKLESGGREPRAGWRAGPADNTGVGAMLSPHCR